MWQVASKPKRMKAVVHRRRFETGASIGSDIVIRFFTLGRSSTFAREKLGIDVVDESGRSEE